MQLSTIGRARATLRQSSRINCEQLEDRMNPNTFWWSPVAGGNDQWSNPQNWGILGETIWAQPVGLASKLLV